MNQRQSTIGKVYLVGAGPGDPGLLTLKGLRCLAEADLVLYDGLVNPLILRHTRADAERTSRVSDATGPKLNQEEINQQLIDAALSGKTVVRLKGGDPFIFGRGSEEAAAVAAHGIPYEVVPGITAATAASEYAGISLTHRDMASAVAFITGHEDPNKVDSALDYAALAAFPGTLVFYMGLHRIDLITQSLIGNGKSIDTPVAVISRGSTARQRTVSGQLSDVSQLVQAAGLHAPSLIIVGECVLQREKINWFETLPLAGVSIGITRPEGHSSSAIDHAFQLGAHPVLMPTIEIHDVDEFTEIDRVIDELSSYDWMVFTSVNGVDAFFNRVWKRQLDARKFASTKIAAIGEATARHLEQYHLRADLVPETFRAEALAEAMVPHVNGKRVLWVKANRGRDILPTQLIAAGAEFDELVVYHHRDVDAFPTEAMAIIEDGALDWIGLSSPSIARNVARLLEGIPVANIPKMAAISPVTEQAAIEAGMGVSTVATEHTWEGIFTAIEQFQLTSNEAE